MLFAKSKRLYHRLQNPFSVVLYPFRVFFDHLVFEERECDEIAGVKAALREIIGELNLAFGLVFGTAPNFEFYDVFLAVVIDNQVHTTAVLGLRFKVTEACAVDNRLDETQEQQTSVVFKELLVAVALTV